MNALSPTQAAYIAGIIDGEGSISYAKYRQGGGVYYQLAVIVANTNREVLEWICLAVGEGKVRAIKTKVGSKQQHIARWCYNDAIQLLRQVLPYLQIKRARAELVLSIDDKSKMALLAAGLTNFGSKGVPSELSAARQETYLQMKELNRRGAN